MTEDLTRPLREVAYAVKMGMSTPESIDVGTLCWTAADALEASLPQSAQGHDALEGQLERAEGRNARLIESIGMLLPLARRFACVAPEHGGPDAEELTPDSFGDGALVPKEVLDAQSLLETGTPPLAESFDLDQFDPSEFMDTDPEPLIAATDIGETVETALSHAHSLLSRRNALRIVRAPVNAALERDYQDTLITLYTRLQEQLVETAAAGFEDDDLPPMDRQSSNNPGQNPVSPVSDTLAHKE